MLSFYFWYIIFGAMAIGCIINYYKTTKKNRINSELSKIYAQTAIDEAACREDNILNELTENR